MELFQMLLETCGSEALKAAFQKKSAASALVPLVRHSNPSELLVRAEGTIRGRYKRLQELSSDRSAK